MRIKSYKLNFAIFALTAFLFLFLLDNTSKIEESTDFEISKLRSSGSPKAGIDSKKARAEYFFKLMRDPATNKIPSDYVENQLKYTRSLRAKGLSKTNLANLFEWSHAGPNNIGGRTRALAIDVRDKNTIIAGGVSGGLWKSVEAGKNFTWQFKNTLDQVLSISYVAQDTRDGHQDTWYASTGEITGNSASGSGAPFRGAGLYKSTDNGDSWSLLPKPGDNPTAWDHPLDYVSKIDVSPTTGSIFIASNAYGVFKSTDGGNSFTNVLETNGRYVEFDISTEGIIVATISEYISFSSSDLANNAGVWISSDDGAMWDEIIPDSWPVGTEYRRSVLDFSTSNPDVFYVLTEVSNSNGDYRLHKFDNSSESATDLSANIPNYSNGPYNSQGSYNMLVAVKPDDENFVLLGGTNLYRSKDGYTTPSSEAEQADIENGWIGGYDNNDGNGSEIGSHPDMHSFAFDPTDPNKVWIGHDGGLSYSDDISATWPEKPTFFGTKNVGYNVTQSYHISIPDVAGDGRIMTGTQDNGTPLFTFTGTPSILNYDASSGDGSFSFFGSNFAYVSTQNGSMIRLQYDFQGRPYDIFGSGGPPPSIGNEWAFIHPTDNLATGQLFINPFVINPNSQNIMHYPAGSTLLRNSRLSSMTAGNAFSWPGNDEHWLVLTDMEAPTGYTYSALEVSDQNSSHVLYTAASGSGKPVISKLTNARSNTGPAEDISIPDIADGVWIHDIAINPENSDEVIVVASNYNVVGLYHTADGGANWTAVEGSLEGENQSGPSLRSAAILPVANGTIYLVGTSVGLFGTASLNGSSTSWVQEGADVIGNVVVESMAIRTADEYVALGTHGRGVFVGTAKELVVDVEEQNELPTEYALSQNYPNPFNPSTKIKYSLPNSGNVKLSVYSVNGEEIAQLVNTSQTAGNYEVEWDGRNYSGRNVASGIYFYTLTSDNFVQTKKMILVK